MQTINLAAKFKKFNNHWSPKIIGDLNDAYVKLAKFKGEFVWHKHDDQDELFFVVKGNLVIKLRDRYLEVGPGEFVIIPKGVEHLPIAKDEVEVMLIEPKATLNTGNVNSGKTVKNLERI